MLLYVVNIFTILIFILLFLITKKTNRRWSKINDYLGTVTNTVNSVRYGNLATKIEELNPNYKNLTESINRMVDTLNDREKMIVEYQAELMRQNKFLEAVINSLSDGILIVDEEYKILRATPKISLWFGLRGSDLIEKNVFDYIKLVKEAPLEKLKNDEIFIHNSRSANFTATTMRLNAEGKKRYILILKDITNEKELETLKEDFVATLTHDLKVPIVAESNMLDLFLDKRFGEITSKQEEALVNMKNSNKELIDLVQILLETYKVNDTGVQLQKEYVMLTTFVYEIVQDMIAIAQKAGLGITFEAKKDYKIMADPLQLKRVVKNLIQNAISHSDTKKDIEVKIADIQGGFVTISIIDHGKGISPDDIKQVFNKYYSTAKKFRKIGTGLGLYLSKQIVKSHEGDIVVHSEENVGTEFCIKLPL